MKIGNISLKNPVISAPLAGISDSVYRRFAKHFGSSLVYSEMLSSMALVYENKKTKFMASFQEEERPINVQLAGWGEDVMAEAAKIVESLGADMIDINAGCSVRKVISNKEGAYLLKDFDKAKEIIRAVVKSVNIPVTIKIRKTWCGNAEETIKFARMAEEEGVSAITVHGRTPAQHFSGKVDLEIIKLVKENLSIPVIGNGDIKTGADAENMMKITGCNGIMIGRAAMGNPWVFREIIEHLEGKEPSPKPSVREKIDLAINHYKILLDYKGEETAFKQMRKFLAWYIKGLKGASRIREKIFTLDNSKDVINLMTEYRDKYEC